MSSNTSNRKLTMFGRDLPSKKIFWTALSKHVYGLGYSTAKKILSNHDIPLSTRVKDIEPEQLSALQKYIENTYTVESTLKRQIMEDWHRRIAIQERTAVRDVRGLCRSGKNRNASSSNRRRCLRDGWTTVSAMKSGIKKK